MSTVKNYKEHLVNIKTIILDVDGVLTDGNVLITNKGSFLRTMSTRDGFVIDQLKKTDIKTIVITGGRNKGVKKRLERIGISKVYLGIQNKLPLYLQLLDKFNLNEYEVMYMGDDIPDLKIMQRVGLPVCPSDAVPEIKKISHYISDKHGGGGCVRDIIEQILKAKGLWEF